MNILKSQNPYKVLDLVQTKFNVYEVRINGEHFYNFSTKNSALKKYLELKNIFNLKEVKIC